MVKSQLQKGNTKSEAQLQENEELERILHQLQRRQQALESKTYTEAETQSEEAPKQEGTGSEDFGEGALSNSGDESTSDSGCKSTGMSTRRRSYTEAVSQAPQVRKGRGSPPTTFFLFVFYLLLICGHNERAMMSRSQVVTEDHHYDHHTQPNYQKSTSCRWARSSTSLQAGYDAKVNSRGQ